MQDAGESSLVLKFRVSLSSHRFSILAQTYLVLRTLATVALCRRDCCTDVTVPFIEHVEAEPSKVKVKVK